MRTHLRKPLGSWIALPLLLLLVGTGCGGGDRNFEASAPAGEGDPASVTEPAGGSAQALIDRSIAFHDPQGLWTTGTFRLEQEASRPEGDSRLDLITIENGGSQFELASERQGKPFVLKVDGDQVELTVEGAKPTAELAAELRLDHPGSLRMRNYYVYLYGLPMKLKDPGALIDSVPTMVELNGREALEVRVAYEADVGSDVWYFNFDPETAELIGYRFYHDEAAEDGEYIVLEGLADIGGLRLPAQRAWFKFEQDEYLGTDSIRQRSD